MCDMKIKYTKSDLTGIINLHLLIDIPVYLPNIYNSWKYLGCFDLQNYTIGAWEIEKISEKLEYRNLGRSKRCIEIILCDIPSNLYGRRLSSRTIKELADERKHDKSNSNKSNLIFCSYYINGNSWLKIYRDREFISVRGIALEDELSTLEYLLQILISDIDSGDKRACNRYSSPVFALELYLLCIEENSLIVKHKKKC